MSKDSVWETIRNSIRDRKDLQKQFKIFNCVDLPDHAKNCTYVTSDVGLKLIEYAFCIMQFLYRFIVIIKGMEMYTIRQGFMINTLLENVVGESKNSVFQQLATDSIKKVKLYSYSNIGWEQ